MNKTTLQPLQKIFSNIVSDMAFLFVGEPDGTELPAQHTMKASISYTGRRKGTLELLCDGRFAASVAANLLGVDPKDPAAEQGRLDALKELMNVVCGNLVTELYGTEDLLELTIPEVSPILPDEPSEAPEGAEVHSLVAEDSTLELRHIIK